MAWLMAIGVAVRRILSGGQWVIPGRVIGTSNSTGRIVSISGESLYDPLIDDPIIPPTAGTVLLDTDFTSWTTIAGSGTWALSPAGSQVNTTEWNKVMGMGTGNSGVAGSASSLATVTMQSDGGAGKFLRFRLPPNSTTTGKGTQLWCNMPQVNGALPDKAVFKYRLRFTGDWSPWGWGGKLPGLGGVAPGTAVSAPSGGNYGGSTGWSGRLMWVGRNASGASSYTSQLNARGNIDVIGLYYNYGFDQIERTPGSAYGDNAWFNNPNGQNSFTAGVWHDVEISYTLNTPSLANGIIEVKVNGVVRYRKTTWRPRSSSTVHISQAWWHIFRGGNDASWALPYETFVDIDSVSITVPA